MLLVMHMANILIQPGENTGNSGPSLRLPQRVSLWDLTWEKIAAFMPSLQKDLFPEGHLPPTRTSDEKETHLTHDHE